jgi:hypothetical protein
MNDLDDNSSSNVTDDPPESGPHSVEIGTPRDVIHPGLQSGGPGNDLHSSASVGE